MVTIKTTSKSNIKGLTYMLNVERERETEGERGRREGEGDVF